MLVKLRAWKAKEVQEKAQEKNLFFFCALCFMGRELASYNPFFFAFQPRSFIGFLVWPLLLKIFDDTGLVKVRYTMRKKISLGIAVGSRNFVEKI